MEEVCFRCYNIISDMDLTSSLLGSKEALLCINYGICKKSRLRVEDELRRI